MSSPKARLFRNLIPFGVAGMIVGEIIWSAVFPGRIYHCPDGDWLGFIIPGDWIHGEVTIVDSVDGNFDMSYQDQLLRGWSNGRLWLCWSCVLFGVVTVSMLAAWLTSSRSVRKNTVPTGGLGADEEREDLLG